MISILNYLTESSLLLGAMILIYYVGFQNDSNIAFRRYFIIFGLALCLIVPLIDGNQLMNLTFRETSVMAQEETIKSNSIIPQFLPEILIKSTEKSESSWAFLSIYLLLSYLAITGYFLIRFSLQIVKLYRYSKQCEEISGGPDDIIIRRHREKSIPFNFLKTVFYTDDPQLSELENRQILKHELAHARQLHSVDNLFLELVSCLWWFHPGIWFIKSELKNVHEYLADREAAGNHEENYTKLLSKVVLKDLGFSLTPSFYKSSILTRLEMINKRNKNNRPLHYVFYTLLMGVLFTVFSCNENVFSEMTESQQNTVEGIEIQDESMTGEEKVFTVVSDPAEPTNGYKDFFAKISTKIEYTEEARKAAAEGKIYVQFVVDENGAITQVMPVRGIGYGLDENAVEVLKSMDNWIPAEQNGVKVKQRIVLPIVYSLDGKAAEIELPSSLKEPQSALNMQVEDNTGDEIFTITEEPASPENGYPAFVQTITKDIKIPEDIDARGKVYIEFVVDRNGRIIQAKVAKGIHPTLDKMALNALIDNSTNWIPAKQRGETVKQRIVLPIVFQ